MDTNIAALFIIAKNWKLEWSLTGGWINRLHGRMLFSNKKEQTINTHNMNEYKKH